MDTILSARDPVDHDRQAAATGRDTLGPDELCRLHAYWRAANYPSVGQTYLYDNPLLREPLKLSHVKLATDENTPTCNKRFLLAGFPQTEASRCAWRELMFTSPELGTPGGIGAVRE